jgi:predicted RND superfamily exporter protein
VLGIAADDIFVFADAWRQSELSPLLKNSFHRRMAYSFTRASKAMMVTSSTTAVAFMANALSEIIPIKAFGIYAAIIVPVNFILVILMVPPMMIFWERKVRNSCSCKSKKKDAEPPK